MFVDVFVDFLKPYSLREANFLPVSIGFLKEKKFS